MANKKTLNGTISCPWVVYIVSIPGEVSHLCLYTLKKQKTKHNLVTSLVPYCSHSGHIRNIQRSDVELHSFSYPHQTSYRLSLLNDRALHSWRACIPPLFFLPSPLIYIPSCLGFTAVYLSRSRCLQKNPPGFHLHMKLVCHSHIGALFTISV